MKDYYYEREADGNGYFAVFKTHNNRTPAHFHNSMEFLAITKGKERVVINGTEYIATEGEFIVCNRFDVHFYENVGDTDVTVVMLSDEYTAHFREVFDTGFASYLPKSEKSEELLALFETLYRNQNQNRLVVTGYVDVLLGMLKQTYPNAQRLGRPSGNNFAQILAYLEDHFTENLSQKAVAANFGYSVNYFSALFNRFAGMHFTEYVNRLRVARAAELIEGGTKVCDAIFACGFESPNSYYRAKHRCTAQKS